MAKCRYFSCWSRW